MAYIDAESQPSRPGDNLLRRILLAKQGRCLYRDFPVARAGKGVNIGQNKALVLQSSCIRRAICMYRRILYRCMGAAIAMGQSILLTSIITTVPNLIDIRP